jgi:hypothetical protein
MASPSIRTVLCAAFLAGCAGSDGPSSPDVLSDTERQVDFGLGLDWDYGVFVQPLWQGGELSYLVINDRNDLVDLVVDALVDDGGAFARERLAGPWTVAARSHQTFSGGDVQTLVGPLMSWLAGDIELGLDRLLERPPVSTTARVVSNHGTNGSGGDFFAQIESDFVVAPGPAFTLTLAVPPGELTLSAHTQLGSRLPILDILAVRSVQATVRQTTTGFSALVPRPEDPAWSYASATDFARIDVDVALPAGSAEAPNALFDAWFWSVSDDGEPRAGNAMTRAFPLRH